MEPQSAAAGMLRGSKPCCRRTWRRRSRSRCPGHGNGALLGCCGADEPPWAPLRQIAVPEPYVGLPPPRSPRPPRDPPAVPPHPLPAGGARARRWAGRRRPLAPRDVTAPPTSRHRRRCRHAGAGRQRRPRVRGPGSANGRGSARTRGGGTGWCHGAGGSLASRIRAEPFWCDTHSFCSHTSPPARTPCLTSVPPGLSPRSVPPRRTTLLYEGVQRFLFPRSRVTIYQHQTSHPQKRPPAPTLAPTPGTTPVVRCSHPSLTPSLLFLSTLLFQKHCPCLSAPPRHTLSPLPHTPTAPLDGDLKDDEIPCCANVLRAERATPFRTLRGATYLWLHPSALMMPTVLRDCPCPRRGRSPSEGTDATRG